jgi:hypothetical protein
LSPEALLQRGYEPCLLQQTSWDSKQAMLKVPRSKIEDRQAVIDVFAAMNREFGDASITGLRHPMRLAGFRNIKPKHRKDGKFPFVRVIATANRFCRLTLDRILRRQEELRPAPIPTPRPRPTPREPEPTWRPPTP